RVVHRGTNVRLRVPNIVVPRILIRLERRVNGLHQPLRRGTSSSIRVPVIDSPRVTSGLLIHSTQDGVSQRQGEPLIGKDLFHEAAPPLHTPTYRTVISGLVPLSLDKADHLILHPIECGLRELTHRPGQLRQGSANGVHDRRNNTGDLVPDPRHEPATTATTGRHRDRKSTRLNSSHVSSSYAVF